MSVPVDVVFQKMDEAVASLRSAHIAVLTSIARILDDGVRGGATTRAKQLGMEIDKLDGTYRSYVQAGTWTPLKWFQWAEYVHAQLRDTAKDAGDVAGFPLTNWIANLAKDGTAAVNTAVEKVKSGVPFALAGLGGLVTLAAVLLIALATLRFSR